jgi:UDP-N-acetylglucosamine 1-carboxyvinyltransferase
MIASLLTQGESRLLNFSHINDVELTAAIIRSLGGQAKKCGERTMFINSKGVSHSTISDHFGPASRSAPMFIPVLLHRFKSATVPFPGGDRIGSRPLDRHFQGLEKMGAVLKNDHHQIHVETQGLVGTDYTFTKTTHTGTETLIMAAVLAQGKTILRNVGLEPEIDDLITFLNHMGANIRRRYHRIIEIQGVNQLSPTIHRIMPDRNEAVSYACAAIATKGDIVVENARREDLEAFLDKLEEIGGGFEIGDYGIRFYHKGPLRATDVVTAPHPGFMTDWQPLWAVLTTQASGDSIIHETIYPSRFQYIKHLQMMGVQAQEFEPEIDHPEKVYNFNYQPDDSTHHAVKISGPTHLKPGEFIVQDLRHGATLVIAATIARGETRLHQIDQIDRGYEELDDRLRSMGAQIERYQSD